MVSHKPNNDDAADADADANNDDDDDDDEDDDTQGPQTIPCIIYDQVHYRNEEQSEEQGGPWELWGHTRLLQLLGDKICI